MVRSRTKLDDSQLDIQLELLTKSMQKQQLACAEPVGGEEPYDVDKEWGGLPTEENLESTVSEPSQNELLSDSENASVPKDLHEYSYSQFMDMCLSGDTDLTRTPSPPHHKSSDVSSELHECVSDDCSISKRSAGSVDDDANTPPTWKSESTPVYSDPVCKECQVGVYQADAGFMVCPVCGDMDEACIETGAEWRSFGGADAKLVDPSRCGSTTSNYLMPPNMYSAGTQISSRWRKETDKMHLAQLLQRRLSANPRSRPLRNTLNEFRRATYNSGYSHKIVDEALHLYTSAKHVKNFRAANRVGLLAKCLSESCKKHGVSRSAKEICKDMGIAVDVMTKGHRALTKARKVAEASNHKINEGSKRTRKTVDQPSDFVDRFCCRLKIPNDITEEIRRVTIEAKAMRLVSDNAPLVASACILLVVQHHKMAISATDIQKVVNISHVTIDKCFKKLRDFKEALVGSN